MGIVITNNKTYLLTEVSVTEAETI